MNEFKCGDVILFSGKGFLSRLIQIGTFSKWSHVGIMLDNVLMLESTTLSNTEDCILKKKISGVQIVKIKDRIKDFEGKIGIKILKKELVNEKKMNMRFVADKLHYVGYEENIWELLKSGIDWLPSTKNNLDTIFCSELVARMWKEACIFFDNKKKLNDYSPKNIATSAKDKYEKIRLITT